MMSNDSILERPQDLQPSFGRSIFKGNNSFKMHFVRWQTQYFSLVRKNFLVLSRRLVELVLLLLIPSGIILTFILGNNHYGYNVDHVTRNENPPIHLSGLGSCAAYHQSDCKRILYTYSDIDEPSKKFYDTVMENVATNSNLQYGIDIIPFPSVKSLQVR